MLPIGNKAAIADIAEETGIQPNRLLRASEPVEGELEQFSLRGLLPDLEVPSACDLEWSLVARAVLKNFARRLIGFEASSPDYLFRNFLAGMSSVRFGPGKIGSAASFQSSVGGFAPVWSLRTNLHAAMVEGEGNMSSSAIGLASPGTGSRSEPTPFRCGAEHLLAELEWLRMVLHREVLRLRAAGLFTEDQFRGLYVSDEQVDAVLRDHYARLAGQTLATEAPPQLRDLDEQIRLRQAEIQARIRASLAAGVSLPLLRLAELFQLSEFECRTLVVCAAAEVDIHFETLYACAQNDVTRKRPSADLVLRLMCEGRKEHLEYRNVLASDGKLLRHGIVRFIEESQDRESSFLARSLKAEERIVGFLLDGSSVDSRLQPFTALSKPSRPLSSLHFPGDLSRELRNIGCATGNSSQVFFFCGASGVGKRSAAEALCAESNRSLLTVDLGVALTSSVSLPTILGLLRREAILCRADLFLAHAEVLLGDEPQHQQHRMAIAQTVLSAGFRVFIGSEVPVAGLQACARGTMVDRRFSRPILYRSAGLVGRGARCDRLPRAARHGRFSPRKQIRTHWWRDLWRMPPSVQPRFAWRVERCDRNRGGRLRPLPARNPITD